MKQKTKRYQRIMKFTLIRVSHTMLASINMSLFALPFSVKLQRGLEL